jgi:hypothetical protein
VQVETRQGHRRGIRIVWIAGAVLLAALGSATAVWKVTQGRTPRTLAGLLSSGGGRVVAIEFTDMYWSSPDGSRLLVLQLSEDNHAELYRAVLSEMGQCRRDTGRDRSFPQVERWTFVVTLPDGREHVVRLTSGYPPGGVGYFVDHDRKLLFKGRAEEWERIYTRICDLVDTAVPLDRYSSRSERGDLAAPNGGAAVQYGYAIQYKDVMHGVLARAPEESWQLSGSDNRDLIVRIACAVRDASILDPALTLADMGLLYVQSPTELPYTVTLTLDDRRRTVFLGHGARESRALYKLLLEGQRKSDGVKPRPWPDDVLAVPHNKW